MTARGSRGAPRGAGTRREGGVFRDFLRFGPDGAEDHPGNQTLRPPLGDFSIVVGVPAIAMSAAGMVAVVVSPMVSVMASMHPAGANPVVSMMPS